MQHIYSASSMYQTRVPKLEAIQRVQYKQCSGLTAGD